MTEKRWLSGKAVAITGAGRGLGRAFALAAALEGCAVVVNDIDEPEASAVAREINASGGRAVVQPGSVADWDVARSIVSTCISAFSRMDGFVNNAGIFHWVAAHEETAEGISEIVATNLTGTMFCGTMALKHMRAQGGGSLVNITSGSMLGIRNQSAYGATKGAIATLTSVWAAETAETAIRVNSVAPRAVTRLSALVEDRAPGTMNVQPELIAPLVVYLLSDLSRDVTGRILRLDGRSLSLLVSPGFSEALTRSDGWSVTGIAEAVTGLLSRAGPELTTIAEPTAKPGQLQSHISSAKGAAVGVVISAVIAGIAAGLLYGLVAFAIVVLYKATGLANFAQGNMATFCVFMIYYIARQGIGIGTAVILGILIAALFGLACYLLVLRANERANAVNLTIRTLALYLLLAAVMEKYYSANQPYQMPNIFPSGDATKGSLSIPWSSVAALVAAAVLLTIVSLFFYRTRAGLLMRGLAEQRSISVLLGVNVRRLTAYAWIIASILGLVVGLMTAETNLLSTDMMDLVLLYAFSAAVIGGLTSLAGAIVGGVTVGIIATLTSVYATAELAQYVVFGAVIIVLLVRPEGIFGVRVHERL